MRDWKDIKEQIKSSEEPLSPGAWQNMKAGLGGNKTKRFLPLLWLALPLLFLLGLGVNYLLPQESYYQPCSQGAVENAISGKEENQPDSSVASAKEGDKTELDQQKTSVKQTVGSQKTQSKSVNKNRSGISEEKGRAILTGDGSEEKLLKLTAKQTTFSVRPLVPQLKPVPKSENQNKLERMPAQKNDSRWELRMYGGLTYNIPNINYTAEASKTHKNLAKAAQNSVKPGWGFDAGAELRYRLFKNIKISTGLGFRQIVTRNSYNHKVNKIPVIDSASGDIIDYISGGNQQVQENSQNRFTFLDVPVSLYYEWPLSQKWILTGEAINHISILVGQNGAILNPTNLEVQDQREQAFNKVINSYQLRLGLRYRWTDNLYIALEPSYRAYYEDFFQSEEVSWKPEDFSLNLSLILKFNNPENP